MSLIAQTILYVILLFVLCSTHSYCVSLPDSFLGWFGSGNKNTEEHIDGKGNNYFKWITWLVPTLGYQEHIAEAPAPQTYFQLCLHWLSWFFITVVQSITYILNLTFITVMYSFGMLYSAVISTFYSLKEIGNLLAILLVLSVLVVTGILCWTIYSSNKTADQEYNKAIRELVFKKKSTSQETDTVRRHWQWIVKCAFWLVIGASLLSIPWEFIRLYQTEQAKRAAVVYAGLPPDCDPHKLTLWQTFKAGLLWHFSWVEHNHCEKYYHAVLVDPLWEVTPMVVLSSFLARCVLHPLEMVSNSLGKSLKLFFSQIPTQWQPVFIIIILLAFLVVLLMTCRYRIRMPMLLAIEPITPTNNRVQSRKTYQVTKHSISGTDKPRQRNKKQRDRRT